MPYFHQRCGQLEIMDTRKLSDAEAEEVYRLIARVNQFLGGRSAVLHHLKYFSRSWRRDQKIYILDVAAGAGDIARAIVKWARKKKQPIQITLFDLSYEALKTAQVRSLEYPEINYLQGSVFEFPFHLESYDYVLSSMFFHHLPEEKIVPILLHFNEVCRRGIIINDLIRCPSAYYGIKALSYFVKSKIFKNDACLSVLRGFTLGEAKQWLKQAGLKYLTINSHFAFRFTVAGEKHAAHV